MAKCPHCGIKLHIWNVKAECPKCGVNIANYDWERRLEEDSVVAEAAFAKLHESMRRFKFSFVGTKLRIARIPVSVLPLFSFLLPLGTLAVSIPYFEQNFTLNAITIVKNIMNFDFGGLISAPGSAVIGAPSLRLLLALLYSPILIIMIFSFTEAKVLGNWTGFSTKLYSSLFTGGMHHSLMNAIWNTFAIALLAATASTALGSIAAIGIFNLRSRTRQVMNFANAIPMMNADIITGVSLFLLFVSFGISQGFTTVVLAHITFCTPYVVLSVMPRLKKMNQNVYEAALDLGATPFQALRKVILPEIFPGMISGFILAFTLSIDDFAVTIFTIGNQGLETLSTYIYADARKGGLTPELRPLSTIIFVTVLVLLIVINKRAERTKND